MSRTICRKMKWLRAIKERWIDVLNKYNRILYIPLCVFVCIFCFAVIGSGDFKTHNVNSNVTLSNKKIGWGIRRNDNNEQPDLGAENKQLIEKYNGISIGNVQSKNVYLTFDAGYEAGYTEKILEVLKQNDVKATFFLTAHYINTEPELVQKMIDEGHTIGNHTPNYLMSGV